MFIAFFEDHLGPVSHALSNKKRIRVIGHFLASHQHATFVPLLFQRRLGAFIHMSWEWACIKMQRCKSRSNHCNSWAIWIFLDYSRLFRLFRLSWTYPDFSGFPHFSGFETDSSVSRSGWIQCFPIALSSVSIWMSLLNSGRSDRRVTLVSLTHSLPVADFSQRVQYTPTNKVESNMTIIIHIWIYWLAEKESTWVRSDLQQRRRIQNWMKIRKSWFMILGFLCDGGVIRKIPVGGVSVSDSTSWR